VPAIALRQASPAGPTLLLPGFDYPDGVPTVSGGVGGWSEEQRPRGLAGTRWAGSPLYRCDMTVWWDGYATSRPVLPALRQLQRWGQGSAGAEPPVLALTGIGYDRMRWVVQDVTPTSLLFRADNQPTQAKVRVQLLEFQGLTGKRTPSDSVRNELLGLAASGLPYAAQTRTVVASSSDTWRAVARRFLHADRRWPEVLALNTTLRPPLPRDPNRRFGRAAHVRGPLR